ncbi:MAG TPA: hypothetical protein VFA32_01065 [Dehalococcoidia bacterium]|nr:hypothetical protein [Dehalococcoidia bacterium]
MEWKFWYISGPKKIPEKVGEALVSRFHLKPADIESWRLVEKQGHLAALTGVVAEDRRVRFIRIFDPARINEKFLMDLIYDDLKTPEGRKALMFEGHVESDGTVHLADRRPPKITIRPIKLDPPKGTAAVKA